MALSYPFRTALVTGASSGIGEHFVHRLAAGGVAPVVVARRGDRLAELAERYPGTEVLVADLATRDGQQAVAARLTDGPPIDLVVNNAGFGTSGAFERLDIDRLTREIEVNAVALTRLSHAALATMLPRRRGWLLNVSSMASFQAAPRLAVYAATKAYVTSLSESLHEEARRHGVHVTALCPGLTRTEFQQVSSSRAEVATFPRPLWTSPDAVARAGLRDVAAGKALSVPGALYTAIAAIAAVTPRRVLRRASSLIER